MPIDPRPGYEIKRDSAEGYILENAMGNALILDSAPTTVNGVLPEGKFGRYSTGLYFTQSGTTYLVATMVAQ